MYPVLNGLYTRGIGTAEDSIFSFTVQVHRHSVTLAQGPLPPYISAATAS